jgi:hypothetical protein
MKSFLFLFVIFFMVLFSASVHSSTAKILPPNSAIYITPMDGGLHEFLQSEFFRQKVPVRIVMKESAAEYVLTGSMVRKQGAEKWYHYLTGTAGTADTAQASVSLFKKGSDTILWATNVGDRSVWWGMLKKKGERKVAQRVVSKFKQIVER